MNLRELRIGTRLGAGFACILLAAGAMLAVALLGSAASRDSLQSTMQTTSTRHAQVTQMRQSLLLSALAVRSMGLQSTVEGVQKDEAEAKRQRQQYLAERTKLSDAGLNADEKALFAKLAELDKATEASFVEAVELSSQFNSEQAAKVILTRIDPLLGQSLATLDAFAKLQQTASEAGIDAANSRHQQTVTGIVGTALVVLGLAAVLAWRLTLSITVPLRSAVASAARVAQGDLATDIPVSGRDEAAQLQAALRDMRSSLAGMVAQVRQGAEAIDGASDEIAQGNADLSSRTETQAGALQQTTSSMEQLTGTVQHSAERAAQALALSQTAAGQADSGHAVVAQVIDTMGAINAHSRKIGEITSVINSIAFQTNILALNAAVEAARAGEQGRGFAVVASEVRTLSQRTTQAAREIEGLIRAAAEQTESGSTLVHQAGSTMDEVRLSVRQVAELINEISAASRAQTGGMQSVNQAISDIDRSTQQNAALVEQAAAAAESMREQTRRLTGLVAAFHV
ncbi:methyl-accepting chemotaxis protein [Pseudaquabacterium pictum]|uniref:methyl-accepting chemotaxis protein n=1 Tax=Pseudaquabacterium pictum TaxID=2315236 RepID=UPI0010FA005C|nr:methyl-accepting chemotaxis protein [Rubrivivax pictus]